MSALVASVIVALSAAQLDADAVKPFTPAEQRELEGRARAVRAKEEEQEKRLDALGCQRTVLGALKTPWRWERFHWGATAGVAGTTAGELGFAAIPDVDYVVVDLKWVCVPATRAELDAAGFAGWEIDWIAVARWSVNVSVALDAIFFAAPGPSARPYLRVELGAGGWSTPRYGVAFGAGPSFSGSGTGVGLSVVVETEHVFNVGARVDWSKDATRWALTIGFRG